jgi:hypothetical protein
MLFNELWMVLLTASAVATCLSLVPVTVVVAESPDQR